MSTVSQDQARRPPEAGRPVGRAAVTRNARWHTPLTSRAARVLKATGLAAAIGQPRWRTPRASRVIRIAVNLAGAVGAALFARASLTYYLQSHRLIGAAFFVEQALFVALFLIRRPARAVSGRLDSWLFAAGGTFGGLLFRPGGAHHPAWGVQAGLGLQLAGLAVVVLSLLALGRSFGFVAADRGLVTRGPYAVVRHPVYAAYIVIQSGYLLQALSVRNAAVLVFATSCNIGRALAEEEVLGEHSGYAAYRRRVRWRLLPGVW